MKVRQRRGESLLPFFIDFLSFFLHRHWCRRCQYSFLHVFRHCRSIVNRGALSEIPPSQGGLGALCNDDDAPSLSGRGFRSRDNDRSSSQAVRLKSERWASCIPISVNFTINPELPKYPQQQKPLPVPAQPSPRLTPQNPKGPVYLHIGPTPTAKAH